MRKLRLKKLVPVTQLGSRGAGVSFKLSQTRNDTFNCHAQSLPIPARQRQMHALSALLGISNESMISTWNVHSQNESRAILVLLT